MNIFSLSSPILISSYF